jgi:diphthamide synthase (EF-2-diphthine--ammonia ligase)
MKILLSWSSGKDSAWTLHRLNQLYPGSVQGLLTTVNEDAQRVAMYGVRQDVLEAQASAAGQPLMVVPIPQLCSNATYQARMGEAVATAVTQGFTHVAFGDLFLEDIRRYREEQLAGSGLEPLFPLWQIPTRTLAHEMMASGLRARLSCIDQASTRAGSAASSTHACTTVPCSRTRCGSTSAIRLHATTSSGVIASRRRTRDRRWTAIPDVSFV